MPDTRLTKQKLKDHWSYSSKGYIIGALLAVALASIFFTMVTNREPADKYSVNFAIVRSYSNTEKLNDVSDTLVARGRQVDPELEAVKFTSIMFDGDASSQDGYSYYQLYILQLSAGGNDFFLQTEEMTRSLIANGSLQPLETMDYFEQFNLHHPDAEIMWEKEPLPEGTEETEENADRPVHAYAVSMENLTGAIQMQAFDNRGMYAGMLISSANPATSMYVLDEFYNLLAPVEEEQTENAQETQE
ncbi:MAG: hypothetical protein K5663_06140 [Clostridiales bacterium]|nr:hypothetical protein [Clostridiales bacterium]